MVIKMKYQQFNDWFDELEGIFSMRGERFHDEFSHIDYETRKRMIEWLQAAWACARNEHE
jgi:hypothetical protein